MIRYFWFEQLDWSHGQEESKGINNSEGQSVVAILGLWFEFIKFKTSMQINILRRQLGEGCRHRDIF